MDKYKKVFLIAIICLVIYSLMMFVIFSFYGLEAGDTLNIDHDTPVYDSYQPGKIGNQVCTIYSGDKSVVIQQLFTGNDIPGAKREAFTDIKAIYVTSTACNGWILNW